MQGCRYRHDWQLIRFSSQRDGSIAVEFALIFPIFVTLVCGMIDFGFIFYTYIAAQQSGWQIARQVAVGQLDASNAASTLRSQLPVWAQPNASIPPVTLSSGTYTVTVTIALDDATPIKLLKSVYGSSAMTTKASFASEGN